MKILGVETLLSLTVEDKTYKFVLPGQDDFVKFEELKEKQDKGEEISGEVRELLQKYATNKEVMLLEVNEDGSISELPEEEKNKTFALIAFGKHSPSIEEISKKEKK